MGLFETVPRWFYEPLRRAVPPQVTITEDGIWAWADAESRRRQEARWVRERVDRHQSRMATRRAERRAARRALGRKR